MATGFSRADFPTELAAASAGGPFVLTDLSGAASVHVVTLSHSDEAAKCKWCVTVLGREPLPAWLFHGYTDGRVHS